MLKFILERIDKRLAAIGISESAAATKAGLSSSAIRNIRRAVRAGKPQGASIRTITAISPVLRTTTTWLLEGTGPEEVGSDYHPALPIEVPLVSWVSAGALVGADTVLETDDIKMLEITNMPPSDWIALKVEGDSMDRISPPDSIIFVDRKDKKLVPNALYVIADHEGRATYKRYRPDPMRFEPVSTNVQNETVFPDNQPAIIGRVRRTRLDM